MKRCAPLLCLSLWAGSAAGAPWEGRVALGGEVHGTSFGIADLGLRKGPLSIQIFTDTLEVRYAPDLPKGRYWVALRGETVAAGLMISPWRDGAPDPARALYAAYVGAEGGWVRYLPASFYLGLGGGARVYLFWPRAETRIEVPGPRPVLSVDLIAGRYTETVHVWLRAGVDAQLHGAAPRVALEAVARPDHTWAPRLELRAAWARNQDFLTRTRLGGLNPYVVPLAGAAWAEWWVESYVATRLGLSVRTPLPRAPTHRLDLSLVTDVAVFESAFATGFALIGKWRHRRLHAEVALGYAPWIKRQPGIGRVSFFCLVGADWGRFWSL